MDFQEKRSSQSELHEILWWGCSRKINTFQRWIKAVFRSANWRIRPKNSIVEAIRVKWPSSGARDVGPMGESSIGLEQREKRRIQGRILGNFISNFQAPQKEGIYQFKIIYKKPGYNFVTLAERVTIRPYKHDQFERFLFVAYPYFFSVWSTIIAAFAFVVIYLYSSW